VTLFGINAATSSARAFQNWPHWFARNDAAAEMRARLSGNLSYARCTACRERRPCRYEMQLDAFFCSETCFGEHYQADFEARGLIHQTPG
jgi:hypothetical protein